jgi:hypothetical protein
MTVLKEGAAEMEVRIHKPLLCLVIVSQVLVNVIRADGPFDRFKAGRHQQLKQEYHTKEVHHGPPYDLSQVASLIDIVEEGILDDGTVVIKRPDVWSQARMTKYRRDFEAQMNIELSKFAAVLSARVARSDQASFESASSLGASLAPSRRGGPAPIVAPQLAPQSGTEGDQAQINLLKAKTDAFKAESDAQVNMVKAQTDLTKAQTDQAKSASDQNIGMLKPADGTSAQFSQTAPFKLLNEKGAFQSFADNVSGGKLGLEPTIYLDEKKRYLDHLNELRRINLGDDNADSAGYSLSLVRLPLSIQPGEKTKKGHGAILTVTARPDFRPDFLPTTFQNLVIHDIIDQFTPILFEILDRDLDNEFLKQLDKLTKDQAAINQEIQDVNQKALTAQQALEIMRKPPVPNNQPNAVDPSIVQQKIAAALQGRASDLQKQLRQNQEKLRTLSDTVLEKAVYTKIPSSRLAARPYPIAPTDMRRVFLSENLLRLAIAIRRALPTDSPRAADIRAFLDQTSEPAYTLLPTYAAMVDEIGRAARSHAFSTLAALNTRLNTLLPNDLANHPEDPVAILCWSIAVDAGLLDERLKGDMKRVAGQNGFNPDCDVDQLVFYFPDAQPKAREVFQAYVNARWPIICFALDPVTDQQNIADALSMRRDLTLAVSFAFSTGKINFNQFNRFRRRIELDAETIALNRTVTAFAHGNETFGWRFYPRYQNPPQEPSNFHVVANQLLRGGPGRDYQVKNSKLEAGQRELTAILILPSFLPKVRFEVVGNWFGLTQPDDLTVPTARMVWQGQQVMKLRHAVTHYCDPRETRPGDLERVLVKVDQVEQMLPMQTEVVNIPFENAQGGFDLFTPGLASLTPVLFGYDGIDQVEAGKAAAFLVFGKNLSIHETKVVAGGRPLGDQDVELLSKEVMRVAIPADVLATALAGRPNRQFVEVVAATPNGISNRLAVPIKLKVEPAAKATKAVAAKTNYTWKTPPAYNVYIRYTDAGVVDPTKPPSIFEFEGPPEHEIVLNTNQIFPRDVDDKTSPLIPESLNYMAMRLRFKDKNGKDVVLDAKTTKPVARFTRGKDEAHASIPFDQHLRDPIRAALTTAPGGLKESLFPKEIPIEVETYILVEGNSTPIKLDDNFTINVKVRDAAAAAQIVPPTLLPPPLPDRRAEP